MAPIQLFASDLSTEEGVNKLKNQIDKQGHKVDVLINNVGVGKYGHLESFSPKDYDWIMDSNMRSTFLLTKAFGPSMKSQRSGNIIFIASVAGLRGLPGEAVYCASKAAQIAFAQSLDYEMRPKGVKVHVIAPGAVNTDFAIGTGRDKQDPILEKMLSANDIAEAVGFVLKQSQKSRVFFVGLKPMDEPL